MPPEIAEYLSALADDQVQRVCWAVGDGLPRDFGAHGAWEGEEGVRSDAPMDVESQMKKARSAIASRRIPQPFRIG
jgi:hypothetical protein